jgi:polyhydroxybutyrate depolymerase
MTARPLVLALAIVAAGPRPPDPAATSASAVAFAPGDHTVRLDSDGRRRSYLLHLPPQATGRRRLPLVVVLHGGHGTGRKMQLGVGFDAHADARGFLVAYPDGYERSWADGRGTTAAEQAGIGDLAFLRRLVDDVARRARLDRGRVFLTGASNGGMMTYRAACETAGLFAAFAPVIANIPEPIAPACSPAEPVRILAINGVSDPLVPLAGGDCCGDPSGPLGQGGRVVSADESIAAFAEAAGCAHHPRVRRLPPQVDDGTAVERRTSTRCGEGSRVIALRVEGMGHAWPPRNPQLPRVSGRTSHNLDATAEIVAFFLGR